MTAWSHVMVGSVLSLLFVFVVGLDASAVRERALYVKTLIVICPGSLVSRSFIATYSHLQPE